MDTQGLTRGRELAGWLRTVRYRRRIARDVAEALEPYRGAQVPRPRTGK